MTEPYGTALWLLLLTIKAIWTWLGIRLIRDARKLRRRRVRIGYELKLNPQADPISLIQSRRRILVADRLLSAGWIVTFVGVVSFLSPQPPQTEPIRVVLSLLFSGAFIALGWMFAAVARELELTDTEAINYVIRHPAIVEAEHFC